MSDDFFERSRAMFDLPEGIVYLDGNSLGAMPRSARERVRRELDESWGRELIRAWNTAGWIDLPSKVGDRIGTLIGAPKGSVIAGDSTSINLFKALTTALELAAPRKVILSDSGNFPTDLYVAEGACRLLGRGHVLKIVDPEAVQSALDERVAVLMLTEVDYRTGRRHDMRMLTEKAKAFGAVMIWDLAHSAGALPVDLAGCGADFAVGCGYKYLNGGPGAPAFVYVRPDLQARVAPALSGWMGHAAPSLSSSSIGPRGRSIACAPVRRQSFPWPRSTQHWMFSRASTCSLCGNARSHSAKILSAASKPIAQNFNLLRRAIPRNVAHRSRSASGKATRRCRR